MKPFSKVSIVAVLLGLAINLDAAVTVIHDWHMGESDLGIGSGDASFSTLDSVGGDILFNQPAGPTYPFYTNNVSGQAAFFAGSDLSIFYSGGQYGMASVIPNLTTNFGLELWIYPTVSTGSEIVAYNGSTGGSGWGIYLSNGTNCMIFFGGAGFSSGAFVATNTWTDVALVCSNKLATLYINGVAASTLNKTPGSPSGSFLVAGDSSGLETFSGAVDEVRVFTFATGSFSPTNLLADRPLVVTTTADSGAGTLRDALAAAKAGSTITFAPSLPGQTITLASTLPVNTSLTIDASALPGGFQINGSNSVTVFNIASGVTDVLNSLTITNGNAGGDFGGGITNNGTLTLNQCTLSGNSAVAGGGIFNGSTLTLNECTLSGNNADNAGGIYSVGFSAITTLNECTLSGNSAPGGYGGGIFEYTGTLTLDECTISGNHAGSGGGIYEFGATISLANTIVADNSAAIVYGLDMYLFNGNITYVGQNLVQYVYFAGVALYGSPPLAVAPDLAPLGNYGGPTQTMPPLPGSPAVNGGSVAADTFATDQRGYPRLIASQIDLGAVEGVYNTNAIVLSNATSLPNGSFQFGFTNDEDMTFNVFATTNLALPFGLWQNLGYAAGAPAGSGQFQFTDTNATNSPQRFYQVVSP